MISESKGIVLYHASYMTIKTVDLSMCKKRNDFGRGFYLTTNREQAERFVKTSIRKSGRSLKSGYVNIYRMSDFQGLQYHEFTTTDAEWLHCVCAFRREELFPRAAVQWEGYDALIGKIANDDTMAIITIYLQNGYGEVESAEAVSTAVRVLKPDRLKDQVCLKTERALSKITFIDAIEVIPG